MQHRMPQQDVKNSETRYLDEGFVVERFDSRRGYHGVGKAPIITKHRFRFPFNIHCGPMRPTVAGVLDSQELGHDGFVPLLLPLGNQSTLGLVKNTRDATRYLTDNDASIQLCIGIRMACCASRSVTRHASWKDVQHFPDFWNISDGGAKSTPSTSHSPAGCAMPCHMATFMVKKLRTRTWRSQPRTDGLISLTHLILHQNMTTWTVRMLTMELM